MTSTERFGYEWSKFDTIYKEHESHFLKWAYPLTKKDFKNKLVLDAGCGNGRNSFFVLKYGAKKVVAFDYDKRTVATARKNLSQFRNAEVHYKSIYDIDYKNKFDMVLCIGVIHHLKDPEKVIANLVNAVTGGEITCLGLWI